MDNQFNNDSLHQLEKLGNFAIEAQSDKIDFDHGFTKLEMSPDRKKHISAMCQQLPAAMAAGTMAQAYVVKFPEGIPHVLTKLHQGGFGTMVQENGKFVGSASLYSLSAQAAILGVFTAMSAASGQYFLAKINSELKMMKMNLDKILEFLYGDKKAELLSEVSFVKYAYQNFSVIMEYEAQRVATIGSLQNARKVAIKDIEFYMSDLDRVVNEKGGSDIISLADEAFQIKKSLELSIQLYGMSYILEMYYAQNSDPKYIKYVESEMSAYIDKCEKGMLSSFSVLNTKVKSSKESVWRKADKSSYEKALVDVIESLNDGGESAIRKSFRSALEAVTHTKEYYLSEDGSVYIKSGNTN